MSASFLEVLLENITSKLRRNHAGKVVSMRRVNILFFKISHGVIGPTLFERKISVEINRLFSVHNSLTRNKNLVLRVQLQ